MQATPRMVGTMLFTLSLVGCQDAATGPRGQRDPDLLLAGAPRLGLMIEDAAHRLLPSLPTGPTHGKLALAIADLSAALSAGLARPVKATLAVARTMTERYAERALDPMASADLEAVRLALDIVGRVVREAGL